MLQAKLERHGSNDAGTLGNFDIVGDGLKPLNLYSIELPWLGNHPNTSCIPTGLYKCTWSLSPHLGYTTPQLINVANRAGIRIHRGNWAGNSAKGYPCQAQGCILIGMTYSDSMGVDGRPIREVLRSRDAFAELENYTQKQEFMLEITDAK